MSRAKNPKYESMSLEELKANMEKSKKELEQAIHNMLEKTQKEQADIKKELSQNQSVLNTEKKLDAQSQQWSEDISEYVDIKELDANLLNRLISKIVISEPQEKDGTENYRRTPETVTMEIHLEPIFSHKRHKASNILISSRLSAK